MNTENQNAGTPAATILQIVPTKAVVHEMLLLAEEVATWMRIVDEPRFSPKTFIVCGAALAVVLGHAERATLLAFASRWGKSGASLPAKLDALGCWADKALDRRLLAFGPVLGVETVGGVEIMRCADPLRRVAADRDN
jgi:hypothetical protein